MGCTPFPLSCSVALHVSRCHARTPETLRNAGVLEAALEHRAFRLLRRVEARLEKDVRAGRTHSEAWNRALVEVRDGATTVMHVVVHVFDGSQRCFLCSRVRRSVHVDFPRWILVAARVPLSRRTTACQTSFLTVPSTCCCTSTFQSPQHCIPNLSFLTLPSTTCWFSCLHCSDSRGQAGMSLCSVRLLIDVPTQFHTGVPCEQRALLPLGIQSFPRSGTVAEPHCGSISERLNDSNCSGRGDTPRARASTSVGQDDVVFLTPAALSARTVLDAK